MRVPLIFLAMLSLGAPVLGQTVDVVLQDGSDGYSGTEDFMMYAPASVAFVNYGVMDTLTAGINRWGEHYASILRFSLRDIPAGARVVSARLQMYDHSPDFPTREIIVDLHELTPVNGDWIEGTGDGTRVGTHGAPSWTFRKFDTDRWAGSGGARTPDVDFRADWSAQAVVPPKQTGWITFDLPPDIVQRWIDDPGANPGLHLWPAMARDKGDIVYLSSSEHETVEQRPKLTISLERTDAVVTALNRATVRRVIANLAERLASARQAAAVYGPPVATAAALDATAASLQVLRDAVPADGALSDEATAGLLETGRGIGDEIGAALTRLPLDRARDWNARRNPGSAYALGVETSMVKVFRRDAPFKGEFTDRLRVQLARNERESAQLVVLPLDTDLRSVTWDVRGFGEDGVTVSAVPVGYVKSVIPALASTPAPSEWWPDPLLDFLKTFDVPLGEAQPLWVTVHASENARPGRHRGTILVGAQNAPTQTLDIEVEVFDFAVPVEQHLKTIWGMTEANFSKFHGEKYNEDVAWRYFDLFLNSRLAVSDLYRTKPNGVRGEDSLWTLANVPALKRLRERGSGWWNVGYVLAPNWALNNRAFGVDTYEEYLQLCVRMFKDEVARLEEADWPRDRMGIYFLDETSDFEALGRAAEVMKEAFPDIPLMTTGYDRTYGLEDTPVSRWMDIWVPLTPRYHEDREKIIHGRELGKKVWWYVCVGPRDRSALNWFIQYPAIRARLLMGVAARKYEVDGFLYYRMAGWNNNDRPITAGPYTDWKPHYHQTLPDGDGQVICGGPDGPLSTVRLENIRDGIEDYEYYWLLDSLVEQAQGKTLSSEGNAALEQAKALQAVPDSLLRSVTEYSESPADLQAQREKVARAIEALRAELEP